MWVLLFILKKNNSSSAGLSTLQHQKWSPLIIWQKWSTRWPSQPTDTQKSPAWKTIKNQTGNVQKYKTSGPGKNKISHRYISLYLFVLHFDSTFQITLGNEILQIFPLLWDKKQKPLMHKVLNAFTSSIFYVGLLNIINTRTLNQLVLDFFFNNIIVTDHSTLKSLTQVYLLPIFLFWKVSTTVW